jgi:hypothetical protein
MGSTALPGQLAEEAALGLAKLLAASFRGLVGSSKVDLGCRRFGRSCPRCRRYRYSWGANRNTQVDNCAVLDVVDPSVDEYVSWSRAVVISTLLGGVTLSVK